MNDDDDGNAIPAGSAQINAFCVKTIHLFPCAKCQLYMCREVVLYSPQKLSKFGILLAHVPAIGA